MADENTGGQQAPEKTDQDAVTAPPEPAPKAATANPWDELGSFDDVKRSLEFSRTWEKRAKENAKKLAEIEESQKTEAQKLQDRLKAAETELTEHRVRDIRARAAREAGLDSDMAEFLTATEAETALKQAKALAKRVQPAKVDLRQGSRQPARAQDDANAWLRRAAGYDRTP